MYNKLFLALAVLLLLHSKQSAIAQCTACTYTPVKMTNCPTTPPKPRGLYVNEFFSFNSPFYGPPMGIDATHSILGVDANNDGIYEKEDALLTYCKANGFSRITLYDIWNVLRFSTSIYGTSTYGNHLKRFITKAKTGNYGITDVGVTIWNPNTPSFVAAYNGIVSSCISSRLADTTPSSGTYFKEKDVDTYLARNQYGDDNQELVNSTASADEISTTEEDLSNAKVDALNSYKIDHMVSEYEFWNTNTFNTVAKRDSAYNVFQKMMNYMNCLKTASVDPLYIYVYLGYLDKDSYDDKVQAQFIDNIADKIYLSNYKCNPNSLFQASIQSRIDVFSASTGTSKANTKIVILLCASNQSDAVAGDPINSGWCDFLGPFLKIAGNTMACAENKFKVAYDAYVAANPGKWNSTLNSFQWYPYTLMKKNSVKRLADENSTSISAADLFSVYPNPSNTTSTFHFTMDSEELSKAFMDITDVNGKLIMHQTLAGLTDENLTVNLKDMNSGIYFCRVVNSNWSSTTSKLVVIK